MYSGKSYVCHLYGMKNRKACVLDIDMELPSVILSKVLCKYIDTICGVLYLSIISHIPFPVLVFLSLSDLLFRFPFIYIFIQYMVFLTSIYMTSKLVKFSICIMLCVELMAYPLSSTCFTKLELLLVLQKYSMHSLNLV